MEESKSTVIQDYEASKKQAAPTREQYKKAMNQFFTVRRPIVEMCGHKIDIDNPPKTNCEVCWFVFFNNHRDLVETSDKCFQEEGKNVLEKYQGKKYVTMFCRFMATINKMVTEEAVPIEKIQ